MGIGIKFLILLNKSAIQKNFLHPKIEIEIVEKIASTNDYLKSFLNHPTIRICLAEKQTAGKGRLQRHWYSPFGENIYLSLLYPLRKEVSEMSGLSLVVSLAMIAACDTFILHQPICVKWPNDVMYQNKKLAGNLIELQTESYGACVAIIGIGINVNMLINDNHEIDQQWTSLREIIGEYIDRNVFVANLLNRLLSYLKRFEKRGFADFITEWHQADYLLGKNITLQNSATFMNGLVQGIDERGHLLMKLQDGTLRSYASGDAQIIKKQLV